MRKTNDELSNLEALMKDLVITQLGCVGVSGAEIRKIVGCDMNRVSRIIKPINKALDIRNKKEKHEKR
jgi:3-methyladenine DNA glycosylase AlkD